MARKACLEHFFEKTSKTLIGYNADKGYHCL